MKKWIRIAALMLMLLLAFTSCGGNDAPDNTDAPSGNGSADSALNPSEGL